MRILLDYRPALRQRTGVGHYIHEIARALAATSPADERLYLFSSSWRDRLAADVIAGAEVIDRPIPVRLLNLAWHRLEWPSVETITGRDFDLVQSAHPLLLPSRKAARIVTIYDLDFLAHPERTRAEIRRDYVPLAASHARRADHVIVISDHTRREVQERLGVDSGRITVCRPGAPSWTPREGEPAAGGTILFLGTLEPRKNLHVLLDAYERLLARDPAAPRLVLAGRHTPASTPLLERVRRAPLAGRVDTPGYVDDAGREELFRKALLFVLPSHTEGFGMPVLEAMVMGVPVVASRRGAIVEAAGSAARLVEPDDPEALAQVIAALLADAQARRRMIDAGWAQTRAFTWAQAADGMRHAWRLALDYHARRRD